jgi:hypothetical protein
MKTNPGIQKYDGYGTIDLKTFWHFSHPVVGMSANITLPQFSKSRKSFITFVSQPGQDDPTRLGAVEQ